MPTSTRSAVWVGDALVDSLLDSSAAPIHFDALIAAQGNVTVSHEHVRVADVAHLADACTRQSDADIIFISVASGLESPAPPSSFEQCLDEALAACPPNARPFLILPSTLVGPESAPGEVQDVTLEIHRRNLAAILAAARTGASVVDLDRLVAETGGRDSVRGLLDYSDEFLKIARDEIVRVLADCRLLSERDDTATQAISMPSMGPALERFEVHAWTASAGSSIATGDELCRLYVNPAHRARMRKDRKGVDDEVSTVERGEVVVYAQEAGVISTLSAEPGTIIQPGDELARAMSPAGGEGAFAISAEVVRERTDDE